MSGTDSNTSTASLATAIPDERIKQFQVWWIVCFTITALMALMNIWVAAAFIKFAKTSSILRKKSRTDMDGGLIFKTALCAVLLSLFRYATTLAVYLVGLDPTANTVCYVVVQISNIFFVAPILAVYFFLWVRQRAFFGHPSIGGLFNSVVSGFSKASLALIILPTVASLIVEMTVNQYKSSAIGCMYSNNQDAIKFRFYIYGGVLSCGQAIMLCLFIFPLYVHSRNTPGKIEAQRDDSTASAVTTIREETLASSRESREAAKVSVDYRESGNTDDEERVGKTRKGRKTVRKENKEARELKFYQLIKRTLILASFSIFSDLTAMISSAMLVPNDTPYYVINILLDFDTTVNIITVVASFKHWKTIIFGINPRGRD